MPASIRSAFFALTIALIASSSSRAQNITPAKAVMKAPASALYFEPADPGQRIPAPFISRGQGYTLFPTREGIVMVLHAQNPPRSKIYATASAQPDIALNIQFRNANRNSKIEPEQLLPAVSNYLIGNDSSRWRTGVPHYARIRYSNLYPGIDLVLYGSAEQLEYDLVVRPGADVSKARLTFVGAQNIGIDRSGDLVIKTAAGELRQSPVRAYSIVRGRKIPVRVEYAKIASDEIGFKIASYSSANTLVLDPVLRYSTLIGGSGVDTAESIAVDSSGHAYIAGSTSSTDFPTTTGVLQRSNSGTVAYVSKFNFDGSGLVFSTFIGGTTGRNFAFGVKVNAAGNAFVTGFTQASDFPTTNGAFQRGLSGPADSFVLKLTPGGAHLVYSTLLGGTDSDIPAGIAIDSAGNAYVAGSTSSVDFPTTPAAISRAPQGGDEVYVTKLNSTGSGLVYSTYLGGTRNDDAHGIALDAANNAYITGNTSSTDFPVTAGAAQTTFGGGTEGGDFFVSKINPAGTALVYSTYVGGSGEEGTEGHGGIAVDSAGSAYITGDTFSVDFPTTASAFQKTGACGPFVTKLNPTGTAFAYSTRLTGSNGDCQIGHGIAVNSAGDAYVIGTTGSTDFPLQQPFQALLRGPFIEQGQHDAFVGKLNAAGSGLIWSSYLGGTGVFDDGLAIALDRDGNAYVAGTASSSDFPTTRNAFQKTAHDTSEAFVAKIIPICQLSTANPSTTICSPAAGGTVSSPVTIIAGSTDSTPVKLLQIYVDGKKAYEAALTAVYVSLPVSAGSHRITAQAVDTNNVVFKKSINVTVR
jgi:hypothetical protein